MPIINEINKGSYEKYNGMTMFRKYDSSEGFTPVFLINEEEDELDERNFIKIPYIEYFKNESGEIINELTRNKHYLVVNYIATYYEDGDEIPEGKQVGDVKTPENMMANNWFISLARTPIQNTLGIMDSIESTLAILPQEIPNGYKLTSQ
jgi:hypothetical protein